jgi:Tol biopolymer transport system component/DNA-binding winged helix-turn-helix (wHTH) protein
VKQATPALRFVRFGIFEVDLRTAELRKGGLKVKLSGQPFQVLTILLEHPGELVTREELRQRLWPSDTFVDFDRGLNAAVNRVREALGDSAETPRFVETLPRRGYRFIGPVDRSEPPESIGIAEIITTSEKSPATRRWKAGVAIGGVAIIVALILVAFRGHRWLAMRSQVSVNEVVPLTTLPGMEISPTFSPDGSQVAFGWDGENNGAGFDLYVKVIGTEKVLRLTNHPAPWLGAAWSPDARSIAVHRLDPNPENAGIFLVPALGGPERKLVSTNETGFPPEAKISWSPDGKQLAYVGDPASPRAKRDNVFLLSLDTLQSKAVETGCTSAYDPAFSPNGRELAYACGIDIGYFSLHTKNLNTGTTLQLWQGPLWINGVAWTGETIVFSAGPPIALDQGGDLWRIAPRQNASPEKIAVGHDATSLAFSPSSRALAYVEFRTNANIWRVDLDEKKRRSRILAPSTREQFGPVISPDGQKLVFMSNRGGANEIWVCDSDGGNAHQVSWFGQAETGTPRWSPDSKKVAFDSRAAGEANVYVVDADGGIPSKLQTGTRINSLPSWSHDGNWIYFASGSSDTTLTIWRAPAQGGRATQLTHMPSSMPIESPDGQYVYFVSPVADKFRLWRMHPDGSNQTMLDRIPPLVTNGYEWWPVESGIYFWRYSEGKAHIDFLDFRSSRIRTIYTPEKPPAIWIGGLSVAPDGKWLVYSRVDERASDLMLIQNFP